MQRMYHTRTLHCFWSISRILGNLCLLFPSFSYFLFIYLLFGVEIHPLSTMTARTSSRAALASLHRLGRPPWTVRNDSKKFFSKPGLLINTIIQYLGLAQNVFGNETLTYTTQVKAQVNTTYLLTRFNPDIWFSSNIVAFTVNSIDAVLLYFDKIHIIY